MILIQNSCSHRVTETVASSNNPVIEHQPAFFCQERHRSGSNLCTLPGTFRERSHFHYTTVLTPILHIGTVADINISERCMTVVTRTAQHGILTVNFLRKQYAVTVKWKEGILTLIEFLEIECITDTDSRSVITVAPCNPVTVFNPSDTRVIFIL